jgi:tetratricopeptide (TPR) repeat protein
MRRFSPLPAAILISAAAAQSLPNFEKAMAAYSKRDYATAAKLLPQFLEPHGEQNSQYREATAALGLSYHFLEQHREAIPLLSKALEWNSNSSEFPYALALSCLRINDAEGARNAFAQMFRIPPDSAQARLLTARFMIREHLENLAWIELEQAARMDSDVPQLHFLIGELAIARGEHDRAVAELQKEIALNPAFGMAHYRLGDVYTRQDKWTDAVAPLQKAIWLNPEFSSPYILLGKVYDKLGQNESAEAMLKKALGMDPNNAMTHYLMGSFYRRLGREAEAQVHFGSYKRLRK